MTALSEYGPLFRDAYAALHGGRPNDTPSDSGRRPDESLEEYLARSRGEALDRLRARLEAGEPPPELRTAHDLLVRLLAAAAEADAAMAAQVEAYRCGNFGDSVSHSDRLHAVITESARLDRDLILALREAEEANAGTLDALGIAEVPEPPI
ncbi:MAG TPA: hypothetical protein VJ253_05355, partial [Dehalococcoidia bacterium]|nr:hypothetical protein [Dehalococcoidia bacterium]